MVSLRMLLAAGLVGTALSATVLAGERLAAEVKTKAIEASVTIDAGLKAYRDLYPRLLAAGKREMAKWRAEADKDYRESPDLFRDGHGYSFARSYEARSAMQGYVSILRTDYSYSGGAHPNTVVDTLLWDSKTEKFINVRPFFTETATNGETLHVLAAAVRAAVLAAKKVRGIPRKIADDPMWLDTIKPDLSKIGGAALAPSTEHDKSAGLLFYFSPYAVGPYVEGSYIVFVPWTVFKAHLSPTGARLFGGARPQGDAKRDEP